MTPENKDLDQQLNPQILQAVIGKKGLRKINLYPLAIGDEIKVSNIFSELLSLFIAASSIKEQSQINIAAIATSLFNVVKENLGTVLGLITDEDGEQLVQEITNVQAEDIIKKVIEVNFTSVSKNLKSLFENSLKLFQSEGQS